MSAEGASDHPAWLVRLGAFFFRTRNGLFAFVLLAFALLTTPVIPSGGPRVGRALDLLGVLIAAAGQALRIAVIGYRYIVRGGRNKQVHADTLVTSGLFAVSRNPLYVGNLLTFAGLFLIWNNPWVYLIGAPFFLLAYRAIVAAEEAFLDRQFGAAYAVYVRQTPRWWPRLSGLAAATAGVPFNWRRVVIKEYSTTAFWVAGAATLLMYKARLYAAAEGRSADMGLYWAVLVAVALLWGWARYLKKSKRLSE